MARPSTPINSLEEQLARLQRQFEEALDAWDGEILEQSGFGTSRMGIDLADRGDTYVLTADVPGFENDEIDIRLSPDRIQITAEREHSEMDEGEFYLRNERARQAMSRSCRLPKPIDESAATASYRNGVLTVHLPKREPEAPNGTKIEIE